MTVKYYTLFNDRISQDNIYKIGDTPTSKDDVPALDVKIKSCAVETPKDIVALEMDMEDYDLNSGDPIMNDFLRHLEL